MRAGALGPQRVALLDAEAVLLVDDDEAQVGEGHALRQQGVGADDDAGVTTRGLGERAAPRGGALRAGEQRDARRPVRRTELAGRRKRTEQRGERAGVLLGEHLGRRQQRRLTAAVDDLQHRAQGDDGLAGADLALQQPVHRRVARQVGGQDRADLRLALRQPERQGGVEGGQQPAVATGTGHAGQRPGGGPALGEHDLQDVGLLEGEPLLGARDVLAPERGVDVAQRLLERDQAVAAPQVLGQRVGAEVDDVERDADRPCDEQARGLGRRRVDRHHRPGELLGHHALLVVHELVLRVRELGPAAEALDLAREEGLATGPQLTLGPAAVEQRDLHAVAAGVLQRHVGLVERLAAAPGGQAAARAGVDLGEDGRELVEHQLVEGGERPALDVAARVVAQQVADGVQAQVGGQGLGGPVPHDRRQARAHRDHGYSTPSSSG